MTATDRKSHWENIYSTRREDEVSWFQEDPALSVALMREAGITPARALKPGGIAIIGTFAPDGPQTCSGLPVCRHDAASLQAILGNDFRLLATRHQEHVTPRGAAQKFQFSTFAKLT